MPDREQPGAGEYIWLAYSLFFFIEPVVRNRPVYWLETMAIFAVFLFLYIANVRSRRRTEHLVLLAAMAVLGLAVMPWNAGGSCFLTFAAAFLPFVVEDATLVVSCFTAGALAAGVEGYLLRLGWINVGMTVFFIAIVGTSNLFISQKKRATGCLLLAQEEIERLAALAERERIARDMHDVLGHTLSVIVLKAELARRLLEQAARERGSESSPVRDATTEVADIEETARKALAEVRHAITGYRSEGLAAEVDLARRTLRAANVTLDLDSSLDPASLLLSATEETVLSLALREAVTNIVRHARASTCLMRLGVAADGFHSLLVEDDGASNEVREGTGLRGMRERVQGLGGRFHVGSGGTSLPGTALLIELPAAAFPERGRP